MNTMRALFLISLLCCCTSQRGAAQEVTVFSSYEQAQQWLESIGWWGEDLRGQQLEAPRTLLIAISPRWRDNAPQMPVAVKKEFFYRCLLPLVAHANALVLDRRARLAEADDMLARGELLAPEDIERLRQMAVLLRIRTAEEAGGITETVEWREVIQEALYRLDVIPAGLALGQAAYESGYGTSRFTVEGNALFGQWAFGGEGLAPAQQRKELGDYRIAAFEWPFDSVRGYFLNLSSHPAYEDFRRIRAEFKAAGKPLSSLALADGLLSYSERGQEYVDSLKDIIRTNHFDVTDAVTQRDEPLGFAFGVDGEEAAEQERARFEEMKKSGEFEEIVARMRLE
jgi:uncharacterized FlgJ-related protein